MAIVSATGRMVLCLALLGAPLVSCAPGQLGGQFSSREQRIGSDDGRDGCRPQLVALDSTGDFFGADILTGAGVGAVGGGLIGGLAIGDWRGALIGAGAGAVTGAAVSYWGALQQQRYDQAALYTRVQGDLYSDNAQIGKTQYAFDALMACRFRQAAAINAAYRARQVDRATADDQMAAVRALAQRDVALARSIDSRIEQRGQQFEVAAGNIAPGARMDSAFPAYAAIVLRPTTLRTSPHDGSPEIGALPARAAVRVTRDRGSYALVEAGEGSTGYVRADDLRTPGGGRGKTHASRSLAPAAAPDATPSGPATPMQVATLAGSNAARRDDFAQSVSVSEKAVASGFGVAG